MLFALENHILEDVNKCVIALQEKDVDGLDRTAGAIRGRAARVVHVVTSEMDNYEPGVYTEKVLEATKLLTDTGINQNIIYLCFPVNVCSYNNKFLDIRKINRNLLCIIGFSLALVFLQFVTCYWAQVSFFLL